MAKPKRKVKADMKRRRSTIRKAVKSDITKKDFHKILDKASQPIEPDKPETE